MAPDQLQLGMCAGLNETKKWASGMTHWMRRINAYRDFRFTVERLGPQLFTAIPICQCRGV